MAAYHAARYDAAIMSLTPVAIEGNATVAMLSQFFLWCSIINLSVSILTFLVVVIGRHRVFRIHSRLFGVPEETAAEKIYYSMINYKTIIFVFNVIPYIAIQIIK